MKKLITLLGTITILASTALATSCSTYGIFDLDKKEAARIEQEVQNYAELSSFATRGNVIGNIGNVNSNMINDYNLTQTAEKVFGKKILTEIKGKQFNVTSKDKIESIAQQVYGTNDLNGILSTNEKGADNIKINNGADAKNNTDEIGNIITLIPTILNVIMGPKSQGGFSPQYIGGMIDTIKGFLTGIDGAEATANSLDEYIGPFESTLKEIGPLLDAILLGKGVPSGLQIILNELLKQMGLVDNIFDASKSIIQKSATIEGETSYSTSLTNRINGLDQLIKPKISDDSNSLKDLGILVQAFSVIKTMTSYFGEFYDNDSLIPLSNIKDKNHIFRSNQTNAEVVGTISESKIWIKGGTSKENIIDVSSLNNMINSLVADNKSDPKHYGLQRLFSALFTQGVNENGETVLNPISQLLVTTILKNVVTTDIDPTLINIIQQLLPTLFSSLSNRDSSLDPTIATIINTALTVLKKVVNDQTGVVDGLIDFLEWSLTPGFDHIDDLFNGNILGKLIKIDGINNLNDILRKPFALILGSDNMSNLPIYIYNLKDISLVDLIGMFTGTTTKDKATLNLEYIKTLISGLFETVPLVKNEIVDGQIVDQTTNDYLSISAVLHSLSSNYEVPNQDVNGKNTLSYALGMNKGNNSFREGSIFYGIGKIFGNNDQAQSNGITHITDFLTNLSNFVKASEQDYWDDNFADWIKPENWDVKVENFDNYQDAFVDAHINYQLTFKSNSLKVKATSYLVTLTRQAANQNDHEYSSKAWILTSIVKK